MEVRCISEHSEVFLTVSFLVILSYLLMLLVACGYPDYWKLFGAGWRKRKAWHNNGLMC